MKLRWRLFIDNPDHPELLSGDAFGIHDVLAPTWWEAREKAAELLSSVGEIRIGPEEPMLVLVRARSLR